MNASVFFLSSGHSLRFLLIAKQCYDQKGREANSSMDDGIRPWLKSFVESVGPVKAQKLLAGVGNFVHLV